MSDSRRQSGRDSGSGIRDPKDGAGRDPGFGTRDSKLDVLMEAARAVREHAHADYSGFKVGAALETADGTIVEMSWFGDRSIALPLGESFHSRRLTLRSSQVGSIPPARRAEWDTRKRMAFALDLLREATLDALVTGDSRFDDLPEVMARLSIDPGDTLCHRIRY